MFLVRPSLKVVFRTKYFLCQTHETSYIAEAEDLACINLTIDAIDALRIFSQVRFAGSDRLENELLTTHLFYKPFVQEQNLPIQSRLGAGLVVSTIPSESKKNPRWLDGIDGKHMYIYIYIYIYTMVYSGIDVTDVKQGDLLNHIRLRPCWSKLAFSGFFPLEEIEVLAPSSLELLQWHAERLPQILFSTRICVSCCCVKARWCKGGSGGSWRCMNLGII